MSARTRQRLLFGEAETLSQAEIFPDALVGVPLELIECAAILRAMRKYGSTKEVAKYLQVSLRKIQYRCVEYRRAGLL